MTDYTEILYKCIHYHYCLDIQVKNFGSSNEMNTTDILCPILAVTGQTAGGWQNMQSREEDDAASVASNMSCGQAGGCRGRSGGGMMDQY